MPFCIVVAGFNARQAKFVNRQMRSEASIQTGTLVVSKCQCKNDRVLADLKAKSQIKITATQ
jgi:propanediol utilization protein